MLLLSIGVAVIAIGVVVVVVAAAFAQHEGLDPRIAFLRVAAASGVMSLGAVVAYLIGMPEPVGISADPVADTALILSAGLMCVAVSMGTQHRAHAAAGFTFVAGAVIATSAELLTPMTARTVLLGALAVTCGSCSFLALRDTLLPRRPVRLIALAMAVYALYSATRAIALILIGPASADTTSPFGFTASLLVSLATYVTVLTATTAMLLPAVREARERTQVPTAVTIADWNLVREAYGLARSRQLLLELRTATHERDPLSKDIRDGVVTALASPLDVLLAPLALEYGWSPDELSLLAVKAVS